MVVPMSFKWIYISFYHDDLCQAFYLKLEAAHISDDDNALFATHGKPFIKHPAL